MKCRGVYTVSESEQNDRGKSHSFFLPGMQQQQMMTVINATTTVPPTEHNTSKMNLLLASIAISAWDLLWRKRPPSGDGSLACLLFINSSSGGFCCFLLLDNSPCLLKILKLEACDRNFVWKIISGNMWNRSEIAMESNKRWIEIGLPFCLLALMMSYGAYPF